ncbi:glycoprotease family metalloendopeptidase [Candidatus Magnetoovum chiemensis]|nr:glycoprotease family metalloendopeptidase [Candidatus Magnetoovum chiemensis]
MTIDILAIDTSCDDTSAAVVRNGRTILSNIVSSQSGIHEKYGGIVPELASRRHTEMIWHVTQEALDRAGVKLEELDAIGVCFGPGLVGSLIVGCSFAKALHYATGVALIGVNHLEGHIFSSFLMDREPPQFPFLCLIVSGGHTSLYKVEGFKQYVELGRTRDDAAGEAYDKAAKMLGLGYPGGPIIDVLAAKRGAKGSISFPRAYLPESYDFSFSGLKTSVKNYIANNKDGYEIEDICKSFQDALVDVLEYKIRKAVNNERVDRVAICGGVAANNRLRSVMERLSSDLSFTLYTPPKSLCTDNAAMIGACAHFYYINGIFADLTLNPAAYTKI